VIVTLTTTVTATAGTSLSVLAEADPDHDIVESNEGNNSKTAITSVVAAPCLGCYDLVAGSIVSTPVSPVLNNTDVTYNFIVTNVGDQSTNTAPNPNDVVVSIDLDTTFNESTPVSVSAPGFTCVTTSPPVLVTDPEIVCTNATGLAGGDGALFSVVVHANTAATPSYVDFDVDVKVLTGEFNPANNSSSLRVFTHA
jgi:archaellum component FlaG (FlaF/FlaG flagellin family)